MKKRIPTFLAGMVTMAVIGGATVTALAAAGSFTITVDPVSIQVNGQVFAPKDVKGNDVPVFAYNGTTYAPLRALAEAYGLTVGYDGASNMATVTDPAVPPEHTATPGYSDWSVEDEATYQKFKEIWKVEQNTHMEIFADEVEFVGETVKSKETDLYSMKYSSGETKGNTDKENRAYFDTHFKSKMDVYLQALLNDLSAPGRNVVIVFQVGGTDVMNAIMLKDGRINTEY